MRPHHTFAVLLTLGIAACSSDASRDPLGPTLSAASSYARSTVDRENMLSIHGTMQTSETDTYVPETNSLVVHLTGSGVAAHLGRFTMVDDGVASLSTGIGTGIVSFTTSDGSTLAATASGHAVIDANIAVLADTITITGGTGRFVGASGVLTASRRIDLQTALSTGTFEGTISVLK